MLAVGLMAVYLVGEEKGPSKKCTRGDAGWHPEVDLFVFIFLEVWLASWIHIFVCLTNLISVYSHSFLR